jgi:hypothetical protein
VFKQRKEFEERERRAEEKRQTFENARERERRDMSLRSMAKSQEMQKVFE